MHCISRRVAGWAVTVVLAAAPVLSALEPPTPEQVRQYKADGTWAQRLAAARALGNDRMHPALVMRTRDKLRRQAIAAGLQVPPIPEPQVPPPGWQGGMPSTGSPKVLFLLIDFPDYPARPEQSVADVTSKCFGIGDPGRFPYESLRSYYQRASYNQLNIQGNVLGWYRAPSSRASYAQTTSSREQLIMAALNYFKGQGHDFTQYDSNADGVVDGLFVKWTGPDEGWASFWWAYQTGWYANPNFRIDGKAVGAYVWSWIANPGYDGVTVYQPHVDIHEAGHMLGLPDYYDYDGSIGPKGGLGGLDMMDGNWGDHNCFSKYVLDWLTPAILSSGAQTLALNPSGISSDCVLIMPGAAPSTLFDEFFMVQYRRRSAGNDFGYPADGLVIWHIDAQLDTSGYDYLYNNSYTDHKLVRLMEADGLEEIERNGFADAGDFYAAGKTFGTGTTPNSRRYTGIPTSVAVDQIGPPGEALSARFSLIPAPYVVAGGAALASEDCAPGNQAIDPNETVTVNFALRNLGTAPTSNLVASLRANSKIVSLSGPQDFGAIPPNGPPVSRPFSFIVRGGCDDLLAVTLDLQDGPTLMDPISHTFHLGRSPLEQDFDALAAPTLPAGWTARVSLGQLAPWMTTVADAQTGPNSVFSADPDGIADNRLESPAVPVVSGNAQLTFRHRYSLEEGYDGGVLEISLNDGPFTDLISAGGHFVSGGYGAALSSNFGNPLGGRSAWTGTSNGFITTVAALPPSAAGKMVRFRWRLGADESFGGNGWYVDSVLIRGSSACCSEPSLGDFDDDGDTDQEDFGRFQACLSGSLPQDLLECLPARMDGDSDVDAIDLKLFQRCHTAANVPTDLNCRNP